MAEAREQRSGRDTWWRRIQQGAQNAVEVARLGTLTVRHGESYEVVERDRTYKLRHYPPRSDAGRGIAPVLLVPPLMLTAEIYDVAPDLSAVGYLMDRGIDTWVIDFGAPEREEGGMERTLDDHVRAVAGAVQRVRALTGSDVHLAGYSQGGMFCYQAAAYLRSEGLASLITFGSPVDIHRNIPLVGDQAAAQLIRAARVVVELPLRHMEGLPGVLTSNVFKLLSLRKELAQLADFVAKLHDRQALEKRETRRRFLAGEGFVAWPGPALRKFIDEFIVHNRMASGGFVIDGRSVSLADIRCPIFAFVGLRDDIARAPSVRAIRDAAPNARVHTVPLQAGHFGLVVGSAANRDTWPAVVAWLEYCAGRGPLPSVLEPEDAGRGQSDEVEDAAFSEPLDVELFYDTAVDALSSVWKRLGDRTRQLGEAVDDLRWQVPRLTRLERLRDDTRIGPGQALSDQAQRMPEQTFFLWKGRAFSYGDADRRVNHIVRGFVECGVMPGHRVGVVMRGRPSFLSVVTALNRIGAIAVIISAELGPKRLAEAIELTPLDALVADPETAGSARRAFGREVLVLGGGGDARELGQGLRDMERIDPERVMLPSWYRENPGRARDLALVFISAPSGGALRAARVTNGRWAFSALGAAAAATLTPKDTVYCCLPLHHPSGLMVAVGGALIGGARLALAMRFDTEEFWPEVRRYGATVAFYAGAMCRYLVNTVPSAADHVHPLRLFAGSGARADVWQRLDERFGPVGVLEFYASTEGNVVLANASGEKTGAVGRELPGSAEVALVRVDFAKREPLTDAAGRWQRTAPDEPGLLAARVDETHPAPPPELGPDGVLRATRVRTDVFEPGDRWTLTSDVLRRDADGDYWFVDRLAELLVVGEHWVSPRFVEDTLYQLPGIAFVSVYAVRLEGEPAPVPVAAIQLRAQSPLDPAALGARVVAGLEPHQRPRLVRFVTEMPFNDGFRILKSELARQDQLAAGARPTLRSDAAGERYLEA